MKKSFLILTILIGCSTFIFNSCSKSDSSTPAPVAAPPVVGGLWKTTISSMVFSLNLNNDYTYSFVTNGAAYETGKYTLGDTSITFLSSTPTSAPPASCYGLHGQYSFKIDTVTTTVSTPRITFALMADSCSTRVTLIIGKWLKN